MCQLYPYKNVKLLWNFLIIIIITDLYSAFRSEDTEALLHYITLLLHLGRGPCPLPRKCFDFFIWKWWVLELLVHSGWRFRAVCSYCTREWGRRGRRRKSPGEGPLPSGDTPSPHPHTLHPTPSAPSAPRLAPLKPWLRPCCAVLTLLKP